MQNNTLDNNPKISIIILNWNGISDTIECLESLKKITYPNYEVIIVDNGSQGNDVQILKERYKDYIRLIRNKDNLGFAEGNNIAIRQVLQEKKSQYILLLNNDTVVDRYFLTELIKVSESNENIGIAGSKNYYYNPKLEKSKIWYNGAKIKWWLGGIKHCQKVRKSEGTKNYFLTEYVVGSSMLIKTSVIKKIGTLDKSYFCYGEDGDFCLRAKKSGYLNVYVPLSIIWHKVNRSSKFFSPGYVYLVTRNKFWLIKRNYQNWQYIIFIIVFLLYKQPIWLIRFLLKRQFRQIKYFYLGIKDGLLRNS